MSKIENVIFDFGNVIVRWDPLLITEMTFGDLASRRMAEDIFHGAIWENLNKGTISGQEARKLYQEKFGFTDSHVENLFRNVKFSQTLIDGTLEVLKSLKTQGYGIYGLTDNVHEIIAYLKSNYNFWPLFDDVVVSADVGVLKPNPEIYRTLLANNRLVPQDCVFFDDLKKNILGAKKIGFQGFVFTSADKCKSDLSSLGIFID